MVPFIIHADFTIYSRHHNHFRRSHLFFGIFKSPSSFSINTYKCISLFVYLIPQILQTTCTYTQAWLAHRVILQQLHSLKRKSLIITTQSCLYLVLPWKVRGLHSLYWMCLLFLFCFCSVSCVPNVTSLDCPFLITSLVLSNVYRHSMQTVYSQTCRCDHFY